MPRTGRPPLPPEQRRTAILRVRLTEAEAKAVEGKGGVEWARAVLVRAAKRKP